MWYLSIWVCVCVCVCVCVRVCVCVCICIGATTSPTWSKLLINRPLKEQFSQKPQSSSQVRCCSPQNSSGASQSNRVAAFCWTTEAAETWCKTSDVSNSSSAVITVCRRERITTDLRPDDKTSPNISMEGGKDDRVHMFWVNCSLTMESFCVDLVLSCSVLQCDPARTAAGIINSSYIRNTRLQFLLQTFNQKHTRDVTEG